MAGENGRGESLQVWLAYRLAFVDFLQNRIGGEHICEDFFKSTAIKHRLAGTRDHDSTLLSHHVAILGLGRSDSVTDCAPRLPVFHDAAQFLAGILQLANARLLPESRTAHLGENLILLAHGLDIHRELVQFSQKLDFTVLETTGLFH
ncbi:hypothetical protein D3C77_248240 [compost metagenome]